MNGTQLARHLRSANLAGAADVQALLQQVPQPGMDDVLPLLELCLGHGADAVQQHLRCTLLVQLIRACGDKRLFLPLVRALKPADQTLRSSLLRALPVVNDPARHDELCNLLREQEGALRVAAARLLSQVDGQQALDRLGQLVKERSFAGRVPALEAAVRIGGHRSVPVLLAAFPVAAATERALIVRLLGDREHMGSQRGPALQALGQLLTDPDETLAVAAIQAFAQLAGEDEWFDHLAPALESTRPAVVRAAIATMAGFSSPRTIATLQGKLRAGPKSVRTAVLDTLEAIATDAVLPVLVDALGHKSLPLRARAGEILGRLGASGKVEVSRTVLWLLRSRDPEVRRMAVEVARQSKDAADVLWPRLFTHLRDEDWWVRERVADALIELGGKRLLRYVVAFLEDPAPPVRMFAVDVVRRLEAPEALGALVRVAQKDDDWWVRERAMEAIAALGDARAVPYLVHIVVNEPVLRLGGLAALTQLGAQEAAPHVAPLLADADADVRLAALRCLEKVGDPSQAPALVPLLSDPRQPIRDLAARLATGWRLRMDVSPTDGAVASPVDRLLVDLSESGGDDLLLMPGRPPAIKRLGEIQLLDQPVLDDAAVRRLLVPLLSAHQLADLDERRDVDLSYEVESHGLRFRANVFHQMHGLAGVFRIVKGAIPTLARLGLPPVVASLGELKNGLVLVGGPTGSGKSTTLAALVDSINRSSRRHVISLEDPIEVVHPYHKGLVNQREVGTHTSSYAAALRATLREDPDVILVGELRDLQTIAFAVSAAETGHLVFGTVHTVSADTTLDRMINTFPAAQQDQVRSMLAGSVRAVVCQYLLPRVDREGRVLACEVMLSTDAVTHMIRTGKCFQLPSVISTCRAQGMQLMDAELLRLLQEGVISGETAWVKARNKRDFEAFLGPGGADGLLGTAAAGG